MIDGSFPIGARMVSRDQGFEAHNPTTGETIEPRFSVSTTEDVAEACALAAKAFDTFRETSPEDRAAFLEEVASQIEALGDELVERAMAESGLPQARLTGERGRTCGQLRMFAAHLRRGDWMNVTFDTPLPDRQPLPRPDLRQRRIAVGPVAVFGASNFPLAFSVAGGDTASALAAGCPVVVKGHPAHPGTTELVARAIQKAVAAKGLPEGVFSLVQGPANELGAALVTDPRIKAVGFTGSRAGGLALVALAQARPEPIPVYAEMSSINPVVLMPAALAARGEALAKGYAGSMTLGAGQFCTNPGIVIGIAGDDLDAFARTAAEAVEAAQPQVMLTAAIQGAYDQGVDALEGKNGVTLLAKGAEGTGCTLGRAALFRTDAQTFLGDPEISQEVFGAASILIAAKDMDEVIALLERLEGQLTATIQLDDADVEAAEPLLPVLERKAGRILANGWPTGVEVSTAMVHGGPFPATSDPRTTSVGTAAIERFLRPVCYQDLPDGLLPKAVRSANPFDLPRTIDGSPEN
ncbi:aldehyde dehydrogenase (NADP(+)) [Stakelama tenebrarum]|uniref:2,5-dioxovalerate dehydrogenase n=1 Tax=Stakelama tenebrarum TaxID=2711215 RepID=A0A6G6Y5N3_9SPHN|nr:aldehyde dehydrogenase (NADP(+)) [Sphingosinithalassobacter tenebrarum]QIG80209.1 aldehyde dehydrogenase (NADP(+)) [Sphingosinithalassobacter tenebrarum]